MKDRAIIIPGPMIPALLAGVKTQHRVPLPPFQKPMPSNGNSDWYAVAQNHPRWGFAVYSPTKEGCCDELVKTGCSPYGSIHTHLYVQETFALYGDENQYVIHYRATNACDGEGMGWKPAPQMRREYSRIELQITDLKIDNLLNMSKADFIAEGMPDLEDVHSGYHQGYAQLWDSRLPKKIGKNHWGSNPLVWIITFRSATRARPFQE